MDNKRVKNQENGGIIIIMKEDYFRNLPSEIIIDILSRLPIRTIITCKVVCKSWYNFITSLEFAKSHLSRSVPGLAASHRIGQHDPRYKVFEFVDEIDPCFHRIFNFKFPHPVVIRCSFDGLLVLGNYGGTCHYICNPVTREYIKLPLPSCPSRSDIIGFGVSKITRQYKLVRMARKSPKCEVYTLGTGSWRSINAAGHSALKYYYKYDECVFLEGVLHCLAFDSNNSLGISCFDLETELFSTFSIPDLLSHYSSRAHLTTLGDCLCLCYDSPRGEETNILSMKEYGDDRLWTKEFVIKYCRIVPFIITDFRVLVDGDILMARKYGPTLVCISPETNTVREIRLAGLDTLAMAICITKVVYTPNFLPVLKAFVTSF